MATTTTVLSSIITLINYIKYGVKKTKTTNIYDIEANMNLLKDIQNISNLKNHFKKKQQIKS